MTRGGSLLWGLGAFLLIVGIAADCDSGSISISNTGDVRSEEAAGGRWWQVGYDDGFQAGYLKCLKDFQGRKEEVISTMRRDISGHLILASMLAVVGVVFGPSITERVREGVVRALSIPLARQVQLAHVLFWSTVALAVFASLENRELKLVAPAVWILLAGALFVFLRELLPAVEEENRAERKAAIGKIKACFFLIFVFYVLLRILSERGFLNLTVAT